MNGHVIRIISACALRMAARAMFDDADLDLSLREEPWVERDSYDAGLLTAAKYLLARADALEAGELEADA